MTVMPSGTAPPNCSGVPSSSSRAVPSAITRCASRITTGSAQAPPIQPRSSPSAVMMARAPGWLDDGGWRQTTVASANACPRRVSSPISASTSMLSMLTPRISRPNGPAGHRRRRGGR